MNSWPRERDCNSFYGNPRGRNGLVNETWKAKNIVTIKPPFKMYFDGKAVTQIPVHRKCADSLLRALNAVWIAAGKSQAKIDLWRVSRYSGCFAYRLKRNGDTLSMHSFGCAIDLDGAGKPMGQSRLRFPPQVVKCFTDEGAVNLKTDPMHFQWAIPN